MKTVKRTVCFVLLFLLTLGLLPAEAWAGSVFTLEKGAAGGAVQYELLSVQYAENTSIASVTLLAKGESLLIVALYAKDGTMLRCKAARISGAAETQTQFVVFSVLPKEVDSVQAFLLNPSTYVPLCPSCKGKAEIRWLLTKVKMELDNWEGDADSLFGNPATYSEVSVNGVEYLPEVRLRYPGVLKLFEYDEFGRLLSLLENADRILVDKNGNEFDKKSYYEYDAFGRLLRESCVSVSFTPLWDNSTGSYKEEKTEIGTIIYCEKINSVKFYTTYSYDACGRILSKHQYSVGVPEPDNERYDDHTVAYQYDRVGNVTKQTVKYASNTVNTDADRYGYWHMNHIITYQYDARGNIAEQIVRYSNGDEEKTTYSYTYDASGNILSVKNSDGVEKTYTYNQQGLQSTLKIVWTYDSLSYQYKYDTYGNLIQADCWQTQNPENKATYYFEYQSFPTE